MDKGYGAASTLEIARRAKVSKREIYAEFGSKSGVLQALIAATSSRMQVPLNPAEITDRHALATALTRYGVVALTELTSPAVLAVKRVAIAEAVGSADLGHILDAAGRNSNRLALGSLISRAQAAGFLGAGDPDRIGGQFFSLLLGDMVLRLLMGVARPPTAAEIRGRAEAATAAVLQLHPA